MEGWVEGVTHWLVGKGAARFQGVLYDYPNVGMCGVLLALIIILLQITFVHFTVKQVCDKRQLIKIETVTQSYLCALSVSTSDCLIK